MRAFYRETPDRPWLGRLVYFPNFPGVRSSLGCLPIWYLRLAAGSAAHSRDAEKSVLSAHMPFCDLQEAVFVV